MHRPKLPSNADRVTKHRAYEEDRTERLHCVHNYDFLMRRAEFEQANEPKTNHRHYVEELDAVQDRKDAFVGNRRGRVKNMLEMEDESLTEEMQKGNMNLNDRRAFLEAEARRLRDVRLQRMSEYAEEQKDRAFCESSDDVRIKNSKLAVLRAEEERKKQRQTNIQKMLQDKEIQKDMHKKMEQEWQRQDDIARAEKEVKDAKKHEAFDILRDQFVMVERLREEEKANVKQEMLNLNRRWKDEEEALKKKQTEKRIQDSQRARAMLMHNEHNRARKVQSAREEKQYDAHMVAMVTEREAEEERQENQLKESQRREAKAYAAQLRAALAQKKTQDDQLESIIKAELEDDWRKRDAETQKREDNRRRLMSQVHEERQAQLHFKEFVRNDEDEAKKLQYQKDRADAELARLEEQNKAQKIKLTKQDVKEYLESQMRHKQAEDLIVQQMKKADFEDTKVAEHKYENKVKQAISSLPHKEPYYGRKAVKWYE